MRHKLAHRFISRLRYGLVQKLCWSQQTLGLFTLERVQIRELAGISNMGYLLLMITHELYVSSA